MDGDKKPLRYFKVVADQCAYYGTNGKVRYGSTSKVSSFVNAIRLALINPCLSASLE